MQKRYVMVETVVSQDIESAIGSFLHNMRICSDI